MPVFMVRSETPEGRADVFTLLPPAVITKTGLAPHAIMGGLTRPLAPGEQVSPDVFARNFFFVEFLHEFLAATAPRDPSCRDEAKRIGNGWVYIIDQRTPTPAADVPTEDVIGAMQVADGRIVPRTYRRNQHHRILSERGFFRLSPWLHARLLDAMTREPSA